MMNKFRLSSNAFERESEEEKILPKKVFFISYKMVLVDVLNILWIKKRKKT